MKVCLVWKGKRLKFRMLSGPQSGVHMIEKVGMASWVSQESVLGMGMVSTQWEADARRGAETDFPFFQ